MTRLTSSLLAQREVDKALDYIDSVISGRRNCGRLERLAVERHLKLFNNPLYYFDEQAADYVLYIFSILKHTSGDFLGKKFELLPWQAFSIYVTFGWKWKDTGKRLIRKSYIRTAKKSGKTELAAGIGIYGTFFDGEGASEVYSAANKYDQACICWKSAYSMAQSLKNDSKKFASRLKCYNSKNYRDLISTVDGSSFKPLASDGHTLDGIRAHFGIIDEYHAAVDTAVIDNIESSMVNRSQPLLYVITTSGFNIHGPCHVLENTLIPILKGEMEDDSVFALIFALDDEDYKKDENDNPKWYDESYWDKTNPSIGVTPTWVGMRSQFTKARNEGATTMTSFMTKNMNIWVRQAVTWVTSDVWKKGSREIVLENLIGRECFAAFDLSTRWDLSCFGLLFPPLQSKEDFIYVPFLYCPEEGAKERSKTDKVPYELWAEKGLLTLTPGNVIDYEYIKEDIKKYADWFDIKRLVYDPYQATQLATQLTLELRGGYDLLKVFGQVITNFNEPVCDLEAWIGTGQLNHGGHEALEWMAGNVSIYTNRTGLRMFDREKSKEKIDGMVVLAMCAGAARDHYKEQGVQVPWEITVI